jgi:hypothetical protein
MCVHGFRREEKTKKSKGEERGGNGSKVTARAKRKKASKVAEFWKTAMACSWVNN